MQKIRKGVVYTQWETPQGEPYLPRENIHGFVYLVTDPAGKKYVGKKMIRENADWRTYKTSCKELKDLIISYGEKAGTFFSFVVLWECFSEKTLKLLEAIEICKHETIISGYNAGLSIRQIGRVDISNAVRL